MHRVGADCDRLAGLADRVAADPHLRLGAVWTHLAVADGAGRRRQRLHRAPARALRGRAVRTGRGGHHPPLTHVANSAGTIGWPAARRDLVRCGIALYGVAPTPALGDAWPGRPGAGGSAPVLSLRTRVTHLRELEAGERPSYGRRRPLSRRSTVATAPIGYADGVPRRLFDAGGEVLVGGGRRPLAGMVTMDQIVIDCGPAEETAVEVGDEVVLLGRQGDEEITADEWAGLLGTISYEVLCAIGPRVPRRLQGDPRPRGASARTGSRRGGRYDAPVAPGTDLDELAAAAAGAPAARWPPAEPRSSSVWATPPPISCSWARPRAATRTCRGSPSSAARAGCSTGCWPRSSASTGAASTSPTWSSAVPPTTATRGPTRSPPAVRSSRTRSARSPRRWWSPSGTSPPSSCSSTDQGITKVRGASYPVGSLQLVPTYHPAAALRSGGVVMAQMRADLIRAKQLLGAGA